MFVDNPRNTAVRTLAMLILGCHTWTTLEKDTSDFPHILNQCLMQRSPPVLSMDCPTCIMLEKDPSDCPHDVPSMQVCSVVLVASRRSGSELLAEAVDVGRGGQRSLEVDVLRLKDELVMRGRERVPRPCARC